MSTLREVPDELWDDIEKVLPPRPPRDKGGRPPANDRVLFNGMFYILRTGAAWREMPPEYGPWQTVYDRFAEWKRAQVFEQIWAKCLHRYDDLHGIEWKWQSSDGTYVRSPLGGEKITAQYDGSRQTRDARSSAARWSWRALERGRHCRQCQ